MSGGHLDVSGRVAVIIGGTSGLGRALAIGLAEAGAVVVPSGRRREMVDQVAGLVVQELRQTVDVSDRGSIDALRDAVLARYGHVHVLINAAGRTSKKPDARGE